jgi:hypothetical protein
MVGCVTPLKNLQWGAFDTGGHLQISGVLLKNLICGYFLNLKHLGIKRENDKLCISLF